MHIFEGVMAATPHGQAVLLASAVGAAAGTAIGLYKLDYERLPTTAVLSSAFFVASAIPVPVATTSVHLVLGGLMGLVLGWSAFPAVLVALLLQTFFLPAVGITTLGLNTLIMALPAVACYYLFRLPVCSRRQVVVSAAGFAAGATAILLGAILSGVALGLAGEPLKAYGALFAAVHVPSAIIEGFITASVVVLLRRVRPEVLDAPLLVSPDVQEAFDG